jgi:peroxiredoxin
MQAMTAYFKISFLFLLCPIVLFGQDRHFEINGTLNGQYTGKIYLFFDGHYKQKDSISSGIKDSRFYFKSHAILPILCRFHLDQGSFIADAYIDSSKLFIASTTEYSIHDNDNNGKDTFNLFKIIKTEGSITDNLKNDFEAWLNDLKKTSIPDEEKRNLHYQKLLQFIKSHPNNKVSQYLLGKATDFFYGQAVELNSFIDTSLSKSFESKGITQMLAGLKEKGDKPTANYIGRQFKFVTLKDSSGLDINTSKLKNKYTLFVFWASWCGPCRAQHNELNSIFEKYKSKGFKMVGISFDTEKEKWLTAIHRDKLNWLQLIDTKAFDGELAKYYQIQAIPTNFLIDKKGNIISIGLNSKEVDEKLKRLL